MGLIVHWTIFAEDKLEDIFNHYLTVAPLEVAIEIADGLVASTICLANTPFIGQKEELLVGRSKEFRYLVYKHFKIIYFVNKKLRNGEEINDDSIEEQDLSLIKAGNDEFGGPNDSFSNVE